MDLESKIGAVVRLVLCASGGSGRTKALLSKNTEKQDVYIYTYID